MRPGLIRSVVSSEVLLLLDQIILAIVFVINGANCNKVKAVDEWLPSCFLFWRPGFLRWLGNRLQWLWAFMVFLSLYSQRRD
jgi:hypothetical protein